MKSEDFEYIKDLLYSRSAIVLEKGKEYLVEARLMPLAREEGCDSIKGLVSVLQKQPFNHLHTRVIEAMATNETSWFRDIHPFEALRKHVIPEIISRPKAERSLSIWCAACSSGQEPYSIAILINEHFPTLANWKVRLIASDLSKEMLERAQKGRYNQLEVNRGLPAALLVKYFQQQGNEWKINDDILRKVEFFQINLVGAWPPLPSMDIIFMRNVLIYFDLETKRTMLGKVKRLLKPKGYLFLGAAETTINIDESFEKIQTDKNTCYRLRTQ